MRRRLLAVFLLAAVAGCSGGGDDDNGGSANLDNDACGVLGLKIIDGTQCQANAAPVVDYRVQYVTGEVSGCTGTMITNTVVLTAGHCFPEEYRGLVAGITVGVGGETVSGSNFEIHPGYSETSQEIRNDVALITLSRSVSVPTVPLLVSRGVRVGDVISIFGYGLDEDGASGVLKSGEMSVDAVSGDTITSIYTGDGSNTCQGDSGGPALLSVAGGTGIVGVTSAGVASAACLVGDVSTFANVQGDDILNFIVANAPGASVI